MTLPYVLYHICPSLSAIHATRARTQHPLDQDSPFCSKCGSFLYNGNAQISLRRKKNIKILRRKCYACSHCQDITIDRGNASLFPKRTRSHKRTPPLDVISHPIPASSPDRTSITPRPKKRLKNTGLQAMLSRNREKEKERLTNQEGSGGLAAFLSGLQNT